MADSVSFKTRVVQTVSQYASRFQSVFVDYEYLVCSRAFEVNPYYIVTAEQDNYMHLTGVPYRNPQLFFDKCVDGSLHEDDIEFVKLGQTEKEVKGSVRRKIAVLPNLIRIFDGLITAQESFSKNRVICSFGTSDGICTVGFILTANSTPLVKPMTLLNGSELDAEKAKSVDLILKRKTGEALFDTVVLGTKNEIETYGKAIGKWLAAELK